MSLNERVEIDSNGNIPNGRGGGDVVAQQPNPGGNQTTNHFFHFDGIYLHLIPLFSLAFACFERKTHHSYSTRDEIDYIIIPPAFMPTGI